MALADRGHIWPNPVQVIEESQKAIIFHNAEEEIMILGTELRAGTETAVLEFIPLPSEPEVSLAIGDPFDVVRGLISEKRLEFEGQMSKGESGTGPVDLVLSEKLGVHDVSVIKVNDLSGFSTWIDTFFRSKGLEVTTDLSGAYNNVEDYLSRGYSYFVLDYVLVQDGTRFFHPLVYRFESDRLYYPLKTSNIVGGEGVIDLILVLPGSLGLLRSGSDVETLRRAFQGSGHLQLSSSSKVYPSELDAVYPGIGDFFESSKMYIQVVRYSGSYEFGDDLVLDVSSIGPYAYKHSISPYDYEWLGTKEGFWLGPVSQPLSADEEKDMSEAYAQGNPDWVFGFPAIAEVLDSTGVGAEEEEDRTPLSRGPREVGEEILEGLAVERGSLTIVARSNGCTDKSSFRVDVRKETGIAEQCPHYALTIYRVRPDECKALVFDGVPITFDLAADLGLTGMYTFSVTNRVYSLPWADVLNASGH